MDYIIFDNIKSYSYIIFYCLFALHRLLLLPLPFYLPAVSCLCWLQLFFTAIDLSSLFINRCRMRKHLLWFPQCVISFGKWFCDDRASSWLAIVITTENMSVDRQQKITAFLSKFIKIYRTILQGGASRLGNFLNMKLSPHRHGSLSHVSCHSSV